MDINRIQGASPVTQVSKTKPVSKTSETVSAQESSSTGEVVLSKTEQPFDQKKVDSLKARIENGTYKPDSTSIARNILGASRK